MLLQFEQLFDGQGQIQTRDIIKHVFHVGSIQLGVKQTHLREGFDDPVLLAGGFCNFLQQRALGGHGLERLNDHLKRNEIWNPFFDGFARVAIVRAKLSKEKGNF